MSKTNLNILMFKLYNKMLSKPIDVLAIYELLDFIN